MMITKEFLEKQKMQQNTLILKLMVVEGKIPKSALKIPREVIKG